MPTSETRRAATLAKIRFLRHVSPPEDARRRGGRMPRQQQPDALRLGYYRALEPIVRRSISPILRAGPEILRLLMDERQEQAHRRATEAAIERARGDAGARGARAKAIVRVALDKSRSLIDVEGVADSARKFADRTSDFNREQLGAQVQQALGVPYLSIEKSTRDVVPPFVTENVALVRTLPDRCHDRLASLVEDAFSSGMRPETLADRIAELEDISDSDAMRIARDQIGKLNGEFNMLRQTDLGVERYVWRTMNDNRVRDEHQDREGETFAWDDPPEGGHPGEDIQCRCYAEPDFSGIVADL